MRGIIYRLQCMDGHFYIGSTTQPLDVRLGFHKWASTVRTSPVYIHINATGWHTTTIEQIAEIECETEDDLKRVENEHIRDARRDPLCLNRNMAIRSAEEKREQDRMYSAAHREQKREQHRKWREQNRERMREHQKKWRDAHKDHIAEYGRQRGMKVSLD